MKVVINKCFGGFGLSRAAVKRMAELQGRPCYFFAYDFATKKYTPLPDDEQESVLHAFDIPNPNEILVGTTSEQSAAFKKHEIDDSPSDRADRFLVQAVEELGALANAQFAKLAVVEIPDGIEWEISEYDGVETIEEAHRRWS